MKISWKNSYCLSKKKKNNCWLWWQPKTIKLMNWTKKNLLLKKKRGGGGVWKKWFASPNIFWVKTRPLTPPLLLHSCFSPLQLYKWFILLILFPVVTRLEPLFTKVLSNVKDLGIRQNRLEKMMVKLFDKLNIDKDESHTTLLEVDIFHATWIIPFPRMSNWWSWTTSCRTYKLENQL